jgi:hypothetical protein
MIEKLKGSCHCERVSFLVELSKECSEFTTRVCDCEFCSKHGASYLSDPNGELSLFSINESDLKHYKQKGTSGIAEMLMCSHCGVLIGAIHDDGNNTWGVVNARVLLNTKFGEALVVSPRQLSDEEKIMRWKQVWFPNVRIEYGRNKI